MSHRINAYIDGTSVYTHLKEFLLGKENNCNAAFVFTSWVHCNTRYRRDLGL